MIIKSLRVRNFRCIRDEALPCDRLTAIVGPNGSGKSTFLRALELFSTPIARYTEKDFFGASLEDDLVWRNYLVAAVKEIQRGDLFGINCLTGGAAISALLLKVNRRQLLTG